MDDKTVRTILSATYWHRMFAAAALLMLAVFLFAAAVAELKGIRFIGSGVTATNTITVSGTADIYAKPDTGEFTATLTEDAKDVASAQAAAAKDENAVMSYLTGAGVSQNDIQTTDYSVYPKYEYQNAACPASSGGTVYCPPGKQVLTGYEVSEALDVKVRDLSKAGTLLSGVGSHGASQVSSLSFTIADMTSVEQQARDKAIADAKGKAQELAGSLGVHLVRIVGFSEDSAPARVAPMAFSAASGATDSAAAPAPEIATGQNKVTSNVSLTYEIE